MIKTKAPGIDVSIVLFCKSGAVPSRILVRDICLGLARPIEGYVTGLSGHQRMQSMMQAREYADAKRREMIVVDLLVNFEQPLYPKVLPPEELPNHDVLNLFRASKELVAHIAAHWKVWVEKDEGVHGLTKYEWSRPTDFVARRTDLLPRLLALPEFRHINVITHPAIASYHTQPVTATSFKVKYVTEENIGRASARFHPDIEVVV